MKKTMLLFVFTFIGVTTTWAQALPFKDSGSEEGKIVQVEVTGNNSLPVNLIRDTHAYFTVVLQALTTINGAGVKLEGYFVVQGTPTPLPVNQESLGGGAPMMYNGNVVKYLIRIGVSKNYPLGNVVIRLVLRNEVTGKVIISFDMPVCIIKAV